MRQRTENQNAIYIKKEKSEPEEHLHNLTIKEITFMQNNDQQLFRPKYIKPVLASKIYHQRYYNEQLKKKKVLPELSLRQNSESKNSQEEKSKQCKNKMFERSNVSNARNSQILNSLIQILKNDPDSTIRIGRSNNTRIKTQHGSSSVSNEFLQSRQISSVKNSRGPKIINNEIMMLKGRNEHRRKLVSEEKLRSKKSSQKQIKQQRFEQMQMTFYKPHKSILNETNRIQEKFQQNQFLNN